MIFLLHSHRPDTGLRLNPNGHSRSSILYILLNDFGNENNNVEVSDLKRIGYYDVEFLAYFLDTATGSLLKRVLQWSLCYNILVEQDETTTRV